MKASRPTNMLWLSAVLLTSLAASPGLSSAALVTESEPDNSLAAAQSVDGHFSLDYSANIGDGGFVNNTSTTIPHVTVTGTGDGTFDYYSFIFPGPGSTTGYVVLDIDFPSSSFDSHVALWASDGTLLGHNDDYDYRGGAGGSVADYDLTMSHDSLMTTYLTTPGTYIVGVARWNAGVGSGGYTGGYDTAEIQSGDLYTLQISVENMPVPEPASLSLAALGTLALLRKPLRAGTRSNR